MPDQLIGQVLTLAMHQAERSVTITTPYFVPSADLLETLKTTAQRGVTVDLIIPKHNDSLMVAMGITRLPILSYLMRA